MYIVVKLYMCRGGSLVLQTSGLIHMRIVIVKEEWILCLICTTYQCPSLSFHLPSLLVVGTGCPFLVVCFVAQGFPCLASAVGAQVQSLACSFVEISP